jgi:putative toxin-antitoxin system antitoxin component (TIGR02293 family)
MSKEAAPQEQAPLLATLRFDLNAVESGLPVCALTKFLSASGMECRDIYEAVISARTLKQWMKRKEPLTMDEGDRLLRLMRVFDQASHVFANREKLLHLTLQAKMVKCTFDGCENFIDIKGFGHEVIGSELHGRDGIRSGAVCRHDDDWQSLEQVVSGECSKQMFSASLRHPPIA